MTLLGVPAMTPEEYATHYDMALLAPDVTESAIREAAQQAVDTGVYGFVFNPCWTTTVVGMFEDTGVVPCACISFPYGTMTSTMKARETGSTPADPCSVAATGMRSGSGAALGSPGR